MRTKTALASAAAALLLLAGACSDDDDSTTSTGDADAVVEATDAWARPTAPGAEAAAVYMDLLANTDDALTGVAVDASVAGEAQIHETVGADDRDDMTDDTAMDDVGDLGEAEMSDDMTEDMTDDMTDDTAMDDMGDGAMSMQQVDSIPLPAGETVALEPGGYHIMLLELAEPLEEEMTFQVTLTFESAPEQTVTVTVGEP